MQMMSCAVEWWWQPYQILVLQRILLLESTNSTTKYLPPDNLCLPLMRYLAVARGHRIPPLVYHPTVATFTSLERVVVAPISCIDTLIFWGRCQDTRVTYAGHAAQVSDPEGE